ncbi:ATPase, F1/V1/A1 complex, alpha/beta subunit, Zinc knuckle CX2CX4HX4C [Artemisia annua]|uniref:ATPase, F1/V1/A1 complex, alpha/beta subunit, Zinc knuckle CX2CX4HX4C n=1 Tax=Artemisia annua TaxID=35608 RepID=A0A2U1Q6V3_ARTAN|nr:ATPase, F1/V1/A1 complex, alpha/beta subunit, Zinc knuckle CX2CX4HX4C [Artemisia annua]
MKNNKQAKGNSKSAHVSFKQDNQKVGSKGNKNNKGVEGGVTGDGNSEAREGYEEGIDGDMGSNIDTDSLDSRSCGDSIYEKEVEGRVSKDDNIDSTSNVAVNNGIGDVNDKNTSINIGDIPVPVYENPILSTRSSPVGSPRILKRGEVLNMNGKNATADFSFNNKEKWPSLSSPNKDANTSAPIEVDGVGNSVVNTKVDTPLAKEVGTNVKIVSFASAVQGLSPSGYTKLRLIPITTSMCDKAYGRANFARILVEIDAQKGLVEDINVCYKSLGKTMQLKVEYPWRPPICNECMVFGHDNDKCSKIVKVDGTKSQDLGNVQVNSTGGAAKEGGVDEWKTVDYRKNGSNAECARWGCWDINGNRRVAGGNYYNSKGGFSGRGRGNMYGRGNNFQRFNRTSTQYVPPKKMNEVNGKDVQNQVTNDKGKGKVDEAISNSQVTIDKAKGNVNEISSVNVTGFKSAGQSSNNQNRFVVLARDRDDDGNDVLDITKARIKGMCGKGEFIREEVMKNWSTDENDNYKEKMQDSIRGMSEDSMKVMILNLEKQISYSNKNIVMGSKAKADSMVKAAMVENGLSENQAFAKERNIRRMQFIERSSDCLFKIVVDNVRLKLMSLNIKYSKDVSKAAAMWKFPVSKDAYYRSMMGDLHDDVILL